MNSELWILNWGAVGAMGAMGAMGAKGAMGVMGWVRVRAAKGIVNFELWIEHKLQACASGVSKYGKKYDEHINEMIDYAYNKGYIDDNGRKKLKEKVNH